MWDRVVLRDALDEIAAGFAFSHEVHEIGGVLFPDGRSIDLIRDRSGTLKLLDSRLNNSAEKVKVGESTYVPAALPPSHLAILTLPSGRTPYGSTTTLLHSIHCLFVEHGYSEETARLMALFAISTWFMDLLPIAPYLRIVGPQPEAHLALQLLASVVRHGLPLIDISQSELAELPLFMQLTLLIDRENPSIASLLSASTYPRSYMLVGGNAIGLCCAKAIYVGATVVDDYFEQPALSIDLSPCQKPFPMLNEARQEAIRAEFQPQLLDYRLANAAYVERSDFDAPELSPNLRIVARILGACIVNAPELQSAIAALLETQHESIRARHWIDPQYVVLEALLTHCHRDPGLVRLGVGEITATANTLFVDRNETTKLEAKSTGNLLRALGFRAKRDSGGYALRLTEALRRQIHVRVRDHQIEEQLEAGCSYCTEILAGGDSEDRDRVA